ncbi:hypothetical protein ALC60_13655, partial [Trachymyrmex zeteki]
PSFGELSRGTLYPGLLPRPANQRDAPSRIICRAVFHQCLVESRRRTRQSRDEVRPMESHAMLVLVSEDKAIEEEEEEEEEEEVVGDLSTEETRVKAFLSEFQVPCRERNIRVFSKICGTACKFIFHRESSLKQFIMLKCERLGYEIVTVTHFPENLPGQLHQRESLIQFYRIESILYHFLMSRFSKVF